MLCPSLFYIHFTAEDTRKNFVVMPVKLVLDIDRGTGIQAWIPDLSLPSGFPLQCGEGVRERSGNDTLRYLFAEVINLLNPFVSKALHKSSGQAFLNSLPVCVFYF